ncbi:MAG: CsbD family protein [Spirochaetes bacterium]|nr:CsbD family protein [Spirochaetota bacterium]
MKSGTQDQTEGRFHKVKGRLREFAEKISMNSGLEASGKDEKRAGKVQEKTGQVKSVLGK